MADDRRGKTIMMTCRVDSAQIAQLRRIAEQLDATISDVIRLAIEDLISHYAITPHNN